MEMCYTKSDAVNTWKAIYFIQDTITNRINSSGKCGVYKKIGLCPFDEKTITFEDDEITYPLTFRSLSKSMAIKSIC